MNFNEKKRNYYYGYVKGTSMWPELIPRDILRAEIAKAEAISPGDIVVLGCRSDNPVVHRLVAKRKQADNSFILFTGGDRSGEDPTTVIGIEEELLKVKGILRKGTWKKPGRKPIPLSSTLPDFFLRLHCKIVKKFFW